MSRNCSTSQVGLLTFLAVMTCCAWSLLTGEVWLWIPVTAALITVALVSQHF